MSKLDKVKVERKNRGRGYNSLLLENILEALEEMLVELKLLNASTPKQ